MRIFHIATASDWAAAQASGSYTTSTRGRTLAEEGFIHASWGDQWQGVRDRFYQGVDEPLVLLAIDTERLTSPVVEENGPDNDEKFPHVYGPINPDAVRQVVALDGESPTPMDSFSRLYLNEVYRRVALAVVAMVVIALGAVTGMAVNDTWGGAAGALAVLALCFAAVRMRRRRVS